jgi:hypothetical protein
MSSEPTFATAAPRRADDSDFAWASPRAGRLVYIDGLRAIAIVAIHARIPRFQGGFVGVDIFFVISGFLITHQIVSQTLAGGFSIDRRRVEQRRSQAVAALSRAAAAFPNVRLIDPLDVFCDSNNCSPFGPTGVFYLDTDHLSALGAELLYRHFERDFLWVFEGRK